MTGDPATQTTLPGEADAQPRTNAARSLLNEAPDIDLNHTYGSGRLRRILLAVEVQARTELGMALLTLARKQDNEAYANSTGDLEPKVRELLTLTLLLPGLDYSLVPVEKMRRG